MSSYAITPTRRSTPSTPTLASPSLDDALSRLGSIPHSSVFVIGGGQLYAACIVDPRCTKVFLTSVESPKPIRCDAFFPEMPDAYERADEDELTSEVGPGRPLGVQEDKGLKPSPTAFANPAMPSDDHSVELDLQGDVSAQVTRLVDSCVQRSDPLTRLLVPREHVGPVRQTSPISDIGSEPSTPVTPVTPTARSFDEDPDVMGALFAWDREEAAWWPYQEASRDDDSDPDDSFQPDLNHFRGFTTPAVQRAAHCIAALTCITLADAVTILIGTGLRPPTPLSAWLTRFLHDLPADPASPASAAKSLVKASAFVAFLLQDPVLKDALPDTRHLREIARARGEEWASVFFGMLLPAFRVAVRRNAAATSKRNVPDPPSYHGWEPRHVDELRKALPGNADGRMLAALVTHFVSEERRKGLLLSFPHCLGPANLVKVEAQIARVRVARLRPALWVGNNDNGGNAPMLLTEEEVADAKLLGIADNLVSRNMRLLVTGAARDASIPIATCADMIFRWYVDPFKCIAEEEATWTITSDSKLNDQVIDEILRPLHDIFTECLYRGVHFDNYLSHGGPAAKVLFGSTEWRDRDIAPSGYGRPGIRRLVRSLDGTCTGRIVEDFGRMFQSKNQIYHSVIATYLSLAPALDLNMALRAAHSLALKRYADLHLLHFKAPPSNYILCDQCNRAECYTSQQLAAHVISCRRTIFRCSMCTKAFPVARDLRLHTNASHLGICFDCPLSGCTKVFPAKGEIRKHIISVHVKPFACTWESCTRSFGRRKDWEDHVAFHRTGEKPAIRKRSRSTSQDPSGSTGEGKWSVEPPTNLIATTTNTNKRRASVTTQTATTTAVSFDRRMQVTVATSGGTTVRPYPPPPPSPQPTTPVVLAVRKREASLTGGLQPKPFRCDMEGCGATFSRKHDLKRHTRVHLGIRPFLCTACRKTFSRHDALTRHIVKWGCDALPGMAPVGGETPVTPGGEE
ncbi:hypothetical protein HKX48_001636, partial [Thoreauomyces humboldtii]